MRLLSLFARPYLRVVLGVTAGSAIVIGGMYAFEGSTATEPRDPSTPGFMYPVVVEPLGPNWASPTPTR